MQARQAGIFLSHPILLLASLCLRRRYLLMSRGRLERQQGASPHQSRLPPLLSMPAPLPASRPMTDCPPACQTAFHFPAG